MGLITGNVKKSRCAIIFTLCLLVFIWILTFAGNTSLEYLQSSLNPDGGLGIITMSINYASKSFSSLLGPFILIHLTPKWTMVVGFLTQLLYIGANAYPEWYTMYPAAVLMGMASGPHWICLGVYTTTLSVYYSHITAQNKSAVMSKFNGIQTLGMPLAIIFGSLISTVVFKYVTFNDENGINFNPYDNTTLMGKWIPDFYQSKNGSGTTNQWDVTYCNVNYCPMKVINVTTKAADISQKPDPKVVYVLLCILALLNITGTLLAILFLKNLPRRDIESTGITMNKSVCKQFIDYIKAFFNWKYLLLTPSIFSLFFFLAIISSTFYKGYVTCSFGIHMVGISALIFGISAGLFSYISGWLGQCIHRNFQFIMAYILAILTLGLLLLWDLFSWFWSYVSYLFVSITAGTISGVIICQYAAFLGDAFTSTKTEAFSFYTFCSGLGMAVGYIGTKYLCAIHQIYLLFGMMALSFVTYTILSIHLYHSQKNPQTSLPDIPLQENGPMISQKRSQSLAEMTDDKNEPNITDVTNLNRSKNRMYRGSVDSGSEILLKNNKLSLNQGNDILNTRYLNQQNSIDSSV